MRHFLKFEKKMGFKIMKHRQKKVIKNIVKISV